jgi:hypothetical protein
MTCEKLAERHRRYAVMSTMIGMPSKSDESAPTVLGAQRGLRW